MDEASVAGSFRKSAILERCEWDGGIRDGYWCWLRSGSWLGWRRGVSIRLGSVAVDFGHGCGLGYPRSRLDLA